MFMDCRNIRNAALAALLGAFSLCAHALNLDGITQKEARAGIYETLNKTGTAAVNKLSAPDGFLNTPQARIPLPDDLLPMKKTDAPLADELEAGMNRAAGEALPQVKTAFFAAIARLHVQDAKGVLAGGEDSITRFFHESVRDQLTDRFFPVVKSITDKAGLASQYDALAEKAVSLGIARTGNDKVEDHVTEKMIDGLFALLAEEERAIRQNPLSESSPLLRKIFGPSR